MTLTIRQTNLPTADGIYTVKAKGCIAASLYWANENGRLPGRTAFAYLPIQPNGVGEFVFRGGRAIPKEATHVFAEAVHPDFVTCEEVLVPIPCLPQVHITGPALRFMVLTDLHLSAKPWAVRKALMTAATADCILLAGDMTNDGTPEQMAEFYRCVTDILPDKPVFAVTGNHDFPHDPIPQVLEGVCNYYTLQDALLRNAARLGWNVEMDVSGAYAAVHGDTEVIGLNAASHWRRFVFRDGEQLMWLERHLENSTAKRHILLCHAPLFRHIPMRSSATQPYLSRDKELQRIVDKYKNIIFISGHTHYSLNCLSGCIEQDEHGNIHINAGSIRPTILKAEDVLCPAEWTDGNVAELKMDADTAEITGFSVKDEKFISRGYYVMKLYTES